MLFFSHVRNNQLLTLWSRRYTSLRIIIRPCFFCSVGGVNICLVTIQSHDHPYDSNCPLKGHMCTSDIFSLYACCLEFSSTETQGPWVFLTKWMFVVCIQYPLVTLSAQPYLLVAFFHTDIICVLFCAPHTHTLKLLVFVCSQGWFLFLCGVLYEVAAAAWKF
jgi:hypothetical protein